MSGNLCRCGAYVRTSSPAIARGRRRRVKPFALRARRQTPATRSAAGARPPAARRYLGGGTNLVDLMKLGVDGARAARRRHPPPARRDRGARRTAACAIGATVRNSDLAAHPRSASATRCWRRRCWPAPPASCATWPPSAATCSSAPAASYFQDVTKPCNKRAPGHAAARRVEGEHRDHAILGALRALRRHPPLRHGRRAGRPRRGRRTSTARRAAPIPLAELHRLPGDAPAARHRARARRPDHRRRAAAARPSAAAPRYRKVRDRASFAFALGLGRRRARRRGRRRRATCASRSAASRPAVAGAARRGGAAGRPRRPRTLRAPRPTPSCQRRSRCATTRSRCR